MIWILVIFTAGGFLNQKFKPKATCNIPTWGQDIRIETAALDSLDATISQKAERLGAHRCLVTNDRQFD